MSLLELVKKTKKFNDLYKIPFIFKGNSYCTFSLHENDLKIRSNLLKINKFH